MADGRRNECKECIKACAKRWRADNPEKWIEYSRGWWAENRERGAEYQRKWQAENREKARAQSAVNNALKVNRLAKPDCCEDCGKETKLHGHHPDYTQPLEVDWLCPVCHSARHSRQRVPA